MIKISSDVTLCILASPPSTLLHIYLHNALPFSLGTSEQVSIEIKTLVLSAGAQFPILTGIQSKINDIFRGLPHFLQTNSTVFTWISSTLVSPVPIKIRFCLFFLDSPWLYWGTTLGPLLSSFEYGSEPSWQSSLRAENFLNAQDTNVFSRRTLLNVVDLSVIRYYTVHLQYWIVVFPKRFCSRALFASKNNHGSSYPCSRKCRAFHNVLRDYKHL